MTVTVIVVAVTDCDNCDSTVTVTHSSESSVLILYNLQWCRWCWLQSFREFVSKEKSQKSREILSFSFLHLYFHIIGIIGLLSQYKCAWQAVSSTISDVLCILELIWLGLSGG